MFKKVLLIILFLGILTTLSNAQTWYPWRQRIYYNSTLCSALTDGKASDLCYQHTTPLLYVCDNAGGTCTTASQWQLLTPFYLSSGIVYSYNNYPMQIGSSGTGTLSASTAINLVVNNNTQLTISSTGISAPYSLGASNSGTNFVCVNTQGILTKSTSACSGT